MKNVIILNGLGGSGKSTFANLCIEYFRSLNYYNIGCEISTVDYVKRIAKLCGWDGSKTAKDRVFLHELKEVLKKWNNSPIEDVLNTIEYFGRDSSNSYNTLIFVNSRESEDIKTIYDYCKNKGYNVLKVNVVREKAGGDEVPILIEYSKVIGNDVTIVNDGDLADLKESSRKFIYEYIMGFSETENDKQ